jgi:nucleotide-binding universal stress UspA family protein/anti-anti-sigma regulatory factor
MIIETHEDVVTLEGALDKNIWPTIQAAANLLLRRHTEGIIVDAGGLTRCSPEGAKTFGDAMDYIEHYHARIIICRLPPTALDCIRMVPGVRSRLPIAETVEDARSSLQLTRAGLGKHTHGRRMLQDILVPLIAADTADGATMLAIRLARADGPKVRIHLAYVLEVPRHLPLNAPLPEEEAFAARLLEAAERCVRKEGLQTATHVCRARDAGEEIVQMAETESVNLIILSRQAKLDPADERTPQILKTVLERAPCEVIMNKLPV